MPKRARSCVFFPRQKKGEEAEHVPRHIIVDYEALEGLFHLPLKEAAHEIGLCQTTFKKACRSFNIEQWPKRQSRTARMNAQVDGDGVDAAIGTLHHEPICAPAATLQTTEMHQDRRAVTVTCTPPVWHNASIAWRDTPPCSFSLSATASSRSTVGVPSELRLDAPSYIDSWPKGSICIGEPMPEGQMTLPCGGKKGGAPPLGAGPPREQSCVEAVMEYLDGPLAGNFDFMFVDEARGAAVGALLS